MPYSSPEGKEWTAQRIVELSPQSILDVGVGAGTYATLLRESLPGCFWAGIEVFEPYLHRFSLDKLYDCLLVLDVRSCPDLAPVDVVICGDVLEHMSAAEARQVWDWARQHARMAVFASIPIVPAPQGAEEGNEFERHLHTWTHAEAMQLPGVRAHCVGELIGVYEGEPASG
jgi:2-polyprenyl-3-methyl-5-hydroxy-6-metoxy-1,4-benzoquinol methylase